MQRKDVADWITIIAGPVTIISPILTILPIKKVNEAQTTLLTNEVSIFILIFYSVISSIFFLVLGSRTYFKQKGKLSPLSNDIIKGVFGVFFFFLNAASIVAISIFIFGPTKGITTAILPIGVSATVGLFLITSL